MKRLLTTLMAATMAAFTLVACANPTPNEALSKLLAVAPESEKAALNTEIIRLCGHHKNAEVPKSCDPAATTTEMELPEAGSTGVLEVLQDVPQDSLPVVVNLYLNYVNSEQTTPDLPDVTLQQSQKDGDAPASDIAAAQQALEAEYAFDYAVGIVEAFDDEQFDAEVDTIDDRHEVVAEKLREALGNNAPARQPAYTFNQPLPTDPATARNFLTTLMKELDTLHVHDAEAAATPEWRLLSLSIAGYFRATTTA